MECRDTSRSLNVNSHTFRDTIIVKTRVHGGSCYVKIKLCLSLERSANAEKDETQTFTQMTVFPHVIAGPTWWGCKTREGKRLHDGNRDARIYTQSCFRAKIDVGTRGKSLPHEEHISQHPLKRMWHIVWVQSVLNMVKKKKKWNEKKRKNIKILWEILL